MASKPDEIEEVTFGVNVSTMAGAFIAAASGVTLRWTGTHRETTS